ncbi:MAG: HAD family hydrolase [Promethearchaeota archaeon]
MFDLDNTLVNLNANWMEIKKNLLKLEKEYFKEVIGVNPLLKDCNKLEKKYGKESVKKICSYLEQEENFAAINLSEINEKGLRLLHLIRKQIINNKKEKIWACILSNNFKSTIEIALKKFNLLHYFDFLIGRDCVLKMKPSAAGLEYISTLIENIKKSEMIMFGDSIYDEKAAIAFGCDFFYIQNLEFI